MNIQSYFYLFSQSPLFYEGCKQVSNDTVNSSLKLNCTGKHNTSLFLPNMYKFQLEQFALSLNNPILVVRSSKDLEIIIREDDTWLWPAPNSEKNHIRTEVD